MTPITNRPFDPAFLTSKEYFWNCKAAQELEICHRNSLGEGDYEALLSVCQNNKKLFRLIASFVPTIDGWSSIEKASAMAALVMLMKPQLCLEIGVFGGRSLIPMALAMQENGFGKTIGIDPYSAEASSAEEVGESATWWAGVNHDAILEKFQGYVKSFRLESVVHLLRVKSDDAEPPSNIDILHIDGGHTEVAVRDAERFGCKVRLGGIAICDDTRWAGGAVLRAMDTLEDMGFKLCYLVRKSERGQSDDWAMYQRVKV